jgi:hypothetical protein
MFNNIHSTIGIQYGACAAKMANLTEKYIYEYHEEEVDITDIGSGNTTDFEHSGEVYEATYEYNYTDEHLESITLTNSASPFLADGVVIPVNHEMRHTYKQLMLATHLLGECNKASTLSDEAMAHPENWQDAI